jgi:hypothetical protein
MVEPYLAFEDFWVLVLVVAPWVLAFWLFQWLYFMIKRRVCDAKGSDRRNRHVSGNDKD